MSQDQPTNAPQLSAAEAQAAAVAAALHHLHLATAAPAGTPQRLSGWAREALLDGVERSVRRPLGWGDAHPWG